MNRNNNGCATGLIFSFRQNIWPWPYLDVILVFVPIVGCINKDRVSHNKYSWWITIAIDISLTQNYSLSLTLQPYRGNWIILLANIKLHLLSHHRKPKALQKCILTLLATRGTSVEYNLHVMKDVSSHERIFHNLKEPAFIQL